MKGENTSCRECGTPFTKKRNKHYHCSKNCCNEYNRKKRGEPLPDFLKNKKKVSSLGNVQTVVVPTNPLYNGVINIGLGIEQQERDLQARKYKLLRKHSEAQKRLNSGNYTYKNGASFIGGLGGIQLGMKIADDITDNDLIRTILGIGFGAAGGWMSQELMKDANGRELKIIRDAEIEIGAIDIKLNEIALKKFAVKSAKKQIPKHAKGKDTVLTAKQFNSIENPSYTFSDKWEILGSPEKNFTMMIYGEPDAGKSHFAVQFASYLSQLPMSNTSDVLFIPFEERDSARLQQKFRRYGFSGSILPYGESLDDVINAIRLKKPRFIFIDSINEAGIDKDGLKTIKNLFPQIAIIAVIQVTKNGQFKGNKDIEHFSNIKVKVSKQEAGSIAEISGKYSTGNVAVFDENNFGNKVLSQMF